MTTPSTDDLREVLHSSSADLPPGLDVLGGVERRAQRQQHRRLGALAAVAAVASLLLVVTFAVRNQAGPPPNPPAGPSPSPTTTADVLPEYLRGGRLVASRETVDARGVSLTFTPSSPRVGFVLGCARSDRVSSRAGPMAVLSIDGQSFQGGSCGDAADPLGLGGDNDFGRDSLWRQYGLEAGRPVTVRLQFDPSRQIPGTRWRLAAYQFVPLADYPFPPAPDQLLPLNRSLMRGLGSPLAAFPPRRPESVAIDCCSYTRSWNHGISAAVQSVAPAHVVMYVDDRPVWSTWFWDYSRAEVRIALSLADLGMRPGDLASVRVTTTGPPRAATFALADSAGP